MQLPDDSVGISDIIAWRECARRASYGMRRHVAKGTQSKDRTPEARNPGALYGSAVHDVISYVEDGYSDEDAVQKAWATWGRFLDIEDLASLHADLATYRQRDVPNTRTVALEEDCRVPLFTHEGRVIWFRFKVDRLYERLDRPGAFVMKDYKSSRWRRTQEDVDSDPQMRSYEFGLYDFFPEIDELRQVYDQLRFGEIDVTPATPEQRAEAKDWLIANVRAMLADESVQADGLLQHSWNDWCAWCPIMESCPVVPELSDWALTRIAALAPRRPKPKKDGTPGKLMEDVPLERDRLPEYVDELRQAKIATGVLERFTGSVNALLKDLPLAEREAFGFGVQDRKATVFRPLALREMHEQLGEDFYRLASVTKASLETIPDEGLRAWALGLGTQIVGTQAIVKRGGG